MEQLKKTLFIFFIVLLVTGSVVGGFYLVKKYTSPQYPKTPIVQQLTVPGMVRDTEGKIPSAFPKGLIDQKNIANVIESYNVAKDKSGEQITFRYISNKDIFATATYFKKYLSSNGWRITGLSDKAKFSSITSIKGQNEKMFVTINEIDPIGIVVDVTYIK
ncbi:MAG: hypothetical protein NTV02_02480 [Candidatus Zambryskibacteria bacterium]|nr:hypothetical protein [Candidatus Zambryskibacteria bacterium]